MVHNEASREANGAIPEPSLGEGRAGFGEDRKMKNVGMRSVVLLLSLLYIVAVPKSFSQSAHGGESMFSVSLGLGVGLHSAPFLVDYMNAFRSSPAEQRLDEFSSMLELFMTPEYRIHPAWSLALEYSLLMKTQTVGGGLSAAGSEFVYNVHMPTAILRYRVSDPAFYLKFGGGVGYHVATLNQTLYSYGVEEHYTTSGLGIKVEAVGNTKFDETFYSSIGVDLRWDFLGAFKNASGEEAYERATKTTARMQFFSFSLKFGIMFQL
jgi:hypothetical protein